MNSTRIRYRENGDGVLVSVKAFEHATNGTRFKIMLNEADTSFKIVEDLSNTIVSEGRTTSLHKTKIKAKAKLVELGITFDDEKRSTQALVEASLPRMSIDGGAVE